MKSVQSQFDVIDTEVKRLTLLARNAVGAQYWVDRVALIEVITAFFNTADLRKLSARQLLRVIAIASSYPPKMQASTLLDKIGAWWKPETQKVAVFFEAEIYYIYRGVKKPDIDNLINGTFCSYQEVVDYCAENNYEIAKSVGI